jgi:hypothetical protein
MMLEAALDTDWSAGMVFEAALDTDWSAGIVWEAGLDADWPKDVAFKASLDTDWSGKFEAKSDTGRLSDMEKVLVSELVMLATSAAS